LIPKTHDEMLFHFILQLIFSNLLSKHCFFLSFSVKTVIYLGMMAKESLDFPVEISTIHNFLFCLIFFSDHSNIFKTYSFLTKFPPCLAF